MKKEIRRVVLGVGRPNFYFDYLARCTEVCLVGKGDKRLVLNMGLVGSYNKIRLVAEVLE